jgi:hypothetical protein
MSRKNKPAHKIPNQNEGDSFVLAPRKLESQAPTKVTANA